MEADGRVMDGLVTATTTGGMACVVPVARAESAESGQQGGKPSAGGSPGRILRIPEAALTPWPIPCGILCIVRRVGSAPGAVDAI